MTKKELQAIVNKLPEGEVRFAVWSGEAGRTIDLYPTGCTPTGQDDVTRIGLSDLTILAVVA